MNNYVTHPIFRIQFFYSIHICDWKKKCKTSLKAKSGYIFVLTANTQNDLLCENEADHSHKSSFEMPPHHGGGFLWNVNFVAHLPKIVKNHF